MQLNYSRKGVTQTTFTREKSPPKDWMSKSGYRVKVWNQDEKKANEEDSLNKLNAVWLNMMDNPKLKEIYNRKLLEFADLEPDEITDVMEYEKTKPAMMPGQEGQPQPGQPQPQQQQQIPARI